MWYGLYVLMSYTTKGCDMDIMFSHEGVWYQHIMYLHMSYTTKGMWYGHYVLTWVILLRECDINIMFPHSYTTKGVWYGHHVLTWVILLRGVLWTLCSHMSYTTKGCAIDIMFSHELYY